MVDLISSTLRLSTPLIFAAMGGLLCERAGIATICLEGVMLLAAFTAATCAYYFENAWIGVFGGIFAGMLGMALHAFLTVTGKSDRIISGVAVNILAAGITPLACKVFFTSATNSHSLPDVAKMPTLSLPFIGHNEILSQQPLVYLAFVFPLFIHFLLYRTRRGNWIYSAGDGPKALETCGVSVNRTRYFALVLGGAVASLGGIYLSVSHASQFTRDMTAGRGFIALAALIFGKWKPIPTMAACLFFGLTDAMQIQLQSVRWGDFEVPIQFLQALPYVVTLLVLVGFVGSAKPPEAIITGE